MVREDELLFDEEALEDVGLRRREMAAGFAGGGDSTSVMSVSSSSTTSL